MKYYAVIDTNVLVSSLLTKKGNSPVVKIIDAIRDSKVIPMYNDEIFAEYTEVIGRDRFGLDKGIVSETLAMIKSRGINCERKPFYEVAISRPKTEPCASDYATIPSQS